MNQLQLDSETDRLRGMQVRVSAEMRRQGVLLATVGEQLPGELREAIEPQLAALEREARRTPFGWHAYESFKSRLKPLVGWSAANPVLASSEAWDLAIDRVLTALETR